VLRSPSLAVRSASGWSLFRTAEIEWAEIVGRFLRLHDVTGAVVLLQDALGAFEQLLKSDSFVRVGRTTVVNESYVCAIECVRRGKFVVVLASEQRLPISRDARLWLEALSVR
jgi:DNA-binding LytR/AlgR family response regulator